MRAGTSGAATEISYVIRFHDYPSHRKTANVQFRSNAVSVLTLKLR